MKRIAIGAFLTLILAVAAFSMACGDRGSSLRLDAYTIERSDNKTLFNYKFMVYGWKNSQVSIQFVNPVGYTANVSLAVSGSRKVTLVGGYQSVVLGNYVLGGDGSVYFDINISYNRHFKIGEVAAVAGNSLSVYASGRISITSITYFFIVESVVLAAAVLLWFILGGYGEILEVYNSWAILFLFYIFLSGMIGVSGPVILDLSMKYPLAYFDIMLQLIHNLMIIKSLAVFSGVLGFFTSSESRVEIFEHLMGVYDRRLLILKIIINPLTALILLLGLTLGVLVAAGGLSVASAFSYWRVVSGPLAISLYVLLIYVFVYILTGGILAVTRRPILTFIISILIIFYINYPFFIRFDSRTGVEFNGYIYKFIINGFITSLLGLLLIVFRWVRR